MVATYNHIEEVKTLCEYVGADWKTATQVTIHNNGYIEIEHVTQREPYLTTEVRGYERIMLAHGDAA